MGAIYKITNLVNGKVYIGQTMGQVIKRYKKHLSQINCVNVCSALYSAFSKYGKDNFIVSTVISGDYSKEELNELEIFFIKKFNSMSPNGYNLQTGKNSFNLAENVKKQISNKLKGRNISWKHKVSEGVKNLWENKEYREKQTLQRYEKRGKYKEGIIKPLRLDLPIDEINRMYSDGKSIYAIAKHFKVPFSTIKRRINYGN
jgi:group I intron endonuclease